MQSNTPILLCKRCIYYTFPLILRANSPLNANNMNFASRLKELRKKKGLSQNELSNLIDVHFTQVSRYERGETKPNAEAMTKMAKALDTTVDFLMNGSTDDAVQDAGLDKELIARFQQVRDMPSEEKKTVLSLIDAYIAKIKLQSMLKVE